MRKQPKLVGYERPLPKVLTWIEESGAHTLYLDRNINVCVHEYVGCGAALFVTCHDLRIERRQLNSMNLDEAKSEAIGVCLMRTAYITSLLAKVK